MRAYLFDIDGTLADLTHRLHYIKGETKNWDAFFADCSGDAPIPHMIELVKTLRDTDDLVLFVSGRSDRVRDETIAWLREHVGKVGSVDLYMRRDGDHRPDFQVKAELLVRIREDGYEPIMAFDDRSTVVSMWREHGVPCAQVAEGNF